MVLLTFCLLLLPLWESIIVLCFVVRYFMSILVLQSSWWGRESWLLCLICLPGVLWWLSDSSSRCHGVVCSLWLWYFLIILTYYFLSLPVKYFSDRSKVVLLLWIFNVVSVLWLLCLCVRLFICALWSPAGKWLTFCHSFVVSNCEFVTFPLVWYPGSGVVLDCIDSWSLHPYLLTL